MMKRNIAISIICILMLCVLTGCKAKKAVSAYEFKIKAESLNYTIVNETYTSIPSSYKSFLEDSVIARSTNGYRVEFYVFEDKHDAKECYKELKERYESYSANKTKKTKNSIGNFSSYSSTMNGYYTYICRVDNTMIYVRAKASYKNDIKEFMKELGYTLL